MRAELNRRGFLGRGAAALLLAGGLPALARAEEDASETALIEPVRTEYESDGDIRVEEGLRCETPTDEGGAVELTIQTFAWPEELNEPSVFVQIYQPHGRGDRSFSSAFTPSELDAFIANLSALRDRARADGIIPRTGAHS